MEYNNPRLDLKNNQKQNSSAIERCNEEKSKRHQEEIKYMKQVDSKGKKQKMQELMN
ncbi:hypothetical protein IJM86_02330 [bacterium]|nr:hypothetical protein [bacterium]